MNTNSYSLLEDLSGKMNHFNQENSPIFSGQMRKPNIWFYSLLSIPAKTKKESIQLTIPYRYSFELNLLNDDQYWDQVEKTFSFKVIEAQKDEALSHLLGVDVMPKRKENATIRLILNDGRIGHYSGEITWVEPASPFWAEAKMKWIDQNEALNDFDYTKYLKTEEGVKYIAGELVNYYAEELKSMLDFSQQAESFASEGVNQKNVEGAASYVAGLYVPYADKIKSTLDMGKIFSKREREENKLLKVINKEIKNEVFTPGTLYREQGADGTRVFFKMKDDKLYLIELGISIL
jgi:hypothetical protein